MLNEDTSTLAEHVLSNITRNPQSIAHEHMVHEVLYFFNVELGVLHDILKSEFH